MCRALFQAPGNLSDQEKSLPLWSLRSGGTPLFVSLGTGLQAPADQTRPHSPAPGELISAASIQKPFSQDPALGLTDLCSDSLPLNLLSLFPFSLWGEERDLDVSGAGAWSLSVSLTRGWSRGAVWAVLGGWLGAALAALQPGRALAQTQLRPSLCLLLTVPR